MAVYLTKEPDGTRIVVEKNAAMLNFIQKHNALQGDDNRYSEPIVFETYEAAVEYIRENGNRDNQHSPIPRVSMLTDLVKDQQKELSAKDLEIAQLRAMVEGQSKTFPPLIDPDDEGHATEMTGAEKVSLIKEAKTIPEINKLLENETRSTVLAAGEKAILKLKIA